MNQRKRDLIAATYDAVPHALFFRDVLETVGGRTAGIHGSRLLVAGAFSHHRQPLEITTKVEASALEKIDLADGSCRGLRDDVLVAEEVPASNRVLSVAPVVGLLEGSGKTVQGGEAWVAQSGRRHEQRAGSRFRCLSSGVKCSGPVSEHNDIPCFHSETPPRIPTRRTAIRCALKPQAGRFGGSTRCVGLRLSEEGALPKHGLAPTAGFWPCFGSLIFAQQWFSTREIR